MPPVIDKKRCNSCGICHRICPQDVFGFVAGTPPGIAYPKECWYCGGCVIDCPQGAVSLRLPLPLHIVPSPALYGPPGPGMEDQLKRAAAFSMSIIPEENNEKD